MQQQVNAFNQMPNGVQGNYLGKQASKQKMSTQKAGAGEYPHQRSNDNKYRTNVQAQM